MAESASSAYAAEAGISQEKYMERFAAPLAPEGVADAIVAIASGREGREGVAFALTGRSLEPL
jgi:hypothetical protein